MEDRPTTILISMSMSHSFNHCPFMSNLNEHHLIKTIAATSCEELPILLAILLGILTTLPSSKLDPFKFLL